jgi:hypothetical protein
LRFSCDDIAHSILRGNRGRPWLPGRQFGASDPRRARSSTRRMLGYTSPSIAAADPIPPSSSTTWTRSMPSSRARRGASSPRKLSSRSSAASSSCRGSSGGFGRDFGGRPGVVAFLLHYLPEDDRRAWLEARGPRARLGYRRRDLNPNAPH